MRISAEFEGEALFSYDERRCGSMKAGMDAASVEAYEA
jgi:hypothetical protein